MQLHSHTSHRHEKPARRVARTRSRSSKAVEAAKRAGGPQDRALYTCGCGYVFTAAVSTSVGCPHCGTHQAW
jgi:hypothetical protein